MKGLTTGIATELIKVTQVTRIVTNRIHDHAADDKSPMTIVKLAPLRSRVGNLLAANSLLAGLPDSPTLLDTLLHDASLIEAAPGEILFYEGSEASHYLLVESGGVEVMRYSIEGEERVFHHLTRGQLVAEVAVFMAHGRYPMTARAQQDTRIVRLPCSGLRQACAHSPDLAMRLLENFSMRIYRRVNEIEWLVASTAAQRLAAYLLDLRNHQPSAKPILRLPLNQRQLASRLGMRAETLSRLLADWAEQGHVRGGRGAWELCNLGHLQALASPAERAF